jgi:hypothetical protein
MICFYISETECVYCEVRTESLHIIQVSFPLEMLKKSLKII